MIMADGGCNSRTCERSEGDERVMDGIECEASASSVTRNSVSGPRRTVSAKNDKLIDGDDAYRGHR
jgi:hypothetical protein